MYEIGDYIMKSTEGLCKVEDIVHLDMYGVDKNRLYYMLIPVNDNKGLIYMPTEKADQKTRKAMTEEEALNLIKRVDEIDEITIENENVREQRYKETIRGGNPESLIGIIKMTYLRNKKRNDEGKKSIAMDERYFELAENNLYSELAFALNKPKDEISSMIWKS